MAIMININQVLPRFRRILASLSTQRPGSFTG